MRINARVNADMRLSVKTSLDRETFPNGLPIADLPSFPGDQ
jgi:hypothetical protein